jgi:hypothetical protein
LAIFFPAKEATTSKLGTIFHIVGSKFAHMGLMAHLEVKPKQRPNEALIIQLAWILFLITECSAFPKVKSTIESSAMSED